MLYRFHRSRILIVVLLLVFVVASLVKYRYKNLSYKKYDQTKRMIKTSSSSSPTVTEEFAEVNGKRFKKIDWHDYEFIKSEYLRNGPGEGGRGVDVSSKVKTSPLFQRLYQEHGFNAYISNNISLDRSLRDIRHANCRKKQYIADLPSASIIIPVRNEHLPTLLRSVHSILNRTPAKLLKEILLVDDASNVEHLKQPLDRHIAKLNKTRVIRLKKREGLVRTRLAGAREAKADILVFFDSHIEVNTNWLPPLLEPIVLNYTTSVCPFIDIIRLEDFAYIAQDEGARGAFDWSLNYKRLPLLPAALNNPSELFDNPVMAGGLFAISKEWFWQLGGYDEHLDIWGGEQYEMSFKIWQCGGRIVDAPCSRVGHVYRQFNPHGATSFGDYVSRNHKRVAVIWMDEYAEYIYKRNPHMRNTNPGAIKKQTQLREKLQCKPFRWYMENIAFDLPKYYPPIILPPYANGEIRSMSTTLCIDTKNGGQKASFGLDECRRDKPSVVGEQEFELSWRQDIRPMGREYCFDVSSRGKNPSVTLYNCHGMRGNQHFIYDITNFHILHVATNYCLDCDLKTRLIFMATCNSQSTTQKWRFGLFNESLIIRDMKQYF